MPFGLKILVRTLRRRESVWRRVREEKAGLEEEGGEQEEEGDDVIIVYDV